MLRKARLHVFSELAVGVVSEHEARRFEMAMQGADFPLQFAVGVDIAGKA
ncbi:hypothetical protein MTR66_05390 [Novosphingobium sp. 2638]|uniref:Uncharacterized protein n=1 Tax=Novosphingobium beihaiensis TaxID=2930389 RepID=A0ABT0BMI6_9SPHN|nr:hypothetical protein [Novosphingobium beihaiensis]MCJ2186249.1 hypothetical protein [Novosphingobium beihaiensis]